MPRLKEKPTRREPLLIGWRERVRLPELAVGIIIAKVDTGARSAALHAEDIEVHGSRVRFRVPLNGRDHVYDLPLTGHRRVKSTSGHSEARAVIETDVQVGEHRFTAEITLTNRTDMGMPMLLGRAAVRGRFVVDPGRSFLLSRKKKRKQK